MEYGNIIFLNGTSSSGKSILAKELQQQLTEPYIHMSLDDVWSMLPAKTLREDEWWKRVSLGKYATGFHNAIAGYSRAGVAVIIDHCINSPDGMKECLELFRSTRVVFVEVSCSVNMLREREKARGDRAVGQAEAQVPGYEKFRATHLYDLQVDTSAFSTSECAQKIIEVLSDDTRKTAFDQMREGNCQRAAPVDR